MNRWTMACLTMVCLGVVPGSTRAESEARGSIQVPAWSEFDGRQCGDLVLEETTRAAFEAKYASSRTERGEVLKATAPKRARTQLFLIFNGPGPEARLTWMVCFYEDPRSAPRPAELAGRAAWREYEGDALTRRAGWRIFAAPDQGLAVVAERRKDSYVVAALIMGDPERVSGAVGRLQPAPPAGSPLAPGDPRTQPQVAVGKPEVQVRVAPTVQVDAARLQREVAQATGTRMRDWPVLRLAEGSEGRLAVMLEIEPRQPGDKGRITLTARVRLDAESDGLAVHTRSPVNRRTIDAASSDLRIQEEARRLVEHGIDAAAGAAQEQLQSRQSQKVSAAQREVRPALLDFLVGAAR
jgi:hypothetical protein